MMSLPVANFIVSDHKMCFAAIPHSTYAIYGNLSEIHTLPEVTSHIILKLGRVYTQFL